MILLLAALSALAQQRPVPDPALAARGAILTFSVPDLDASARWYTGKLGLRIVHRYPRTPGVRARAALFQGGGLAVELVQEDDAVDPPPQLRHGLAKAGLIISNFDAAVAALRARGVEFASAYPRRADDPANVTIRDNAGNLIALYEGFSSFNDPLIDLIQIDALGAPVDLSGSSPPAGGGALGCFAGRVVRDTATPETPITAATGLQGATVTLYTKSPSGGALGKGLVSVKSDPTGRWTIPHRAGGTFIIAIVPPHDSGYHGVFTECAASGSRTLSVALPRR